MPVASGLQPTRSGRVNCPFHEDRTPSLQLYEDGSFYCFGCDRGGTIYDFAARLWGIGTERREFLELRARLVGELAIGAGA
jgi:DNA primase